MFADEEGCLTVFLRLAALIFVGIAGGLLFSFYFPEHILSIRPVITRAVPVQVKQVIQKANRERKRFFLFPGEVQGLQQDLNVTREQLLTERAFKEQLIKQIQDDRPYIVVSLSENILYLKQKDKVLRACSVATGKQTTEEIQGRLYHFFTPRTIFTISRKEVDPKWVMPDWAYLERGETPPPVESRPSIPGALGAYALHLQHSYIIHGTANNATLGKYITHGCIRMGAQDLKALYDFVPVGTKVYIY